MHTSVPFGIVIHASVTRTVDLGWVLLSHTIGLLTLFLELSLDTWLYSWPDLLITWLDHLCDSNHAIFLLCMGVRVFLYFTYLYEIYDFLDLHVQMLRTCLGRNHFLKRNPYSRKIQCLNKRLGTLRTFLSSSRRPSTLPFASFIFVEVAPLSFVLV